MRRNITIDPLARALAVEKPAITEVMSIRTGKYWSANAFIRGRRHEAVIRVRNALREDMAMGKRRLACPHCLVEVYLVASPLKAFFFRHRTEDGSCPAVTRHHLTESQIRASKYAGAQESEAHKRVKRLLMRSISSDASFEVPAEERTWKSIVRPGRYRRPDVSAKHGERWIAFEVQLSTTFISVVAERRAFYRSEGGLLVWALARFDPDDRRLIEDDILFPNNSNILVVDDETAAASEAAGRFMVKCHYREPNVTTMDGHSVWAVRLVGFDELQLDIERQRAFLVDVEKLERDRRHELEGRRAEEARAADEALRRDFIAVAACPHDELPTFEEVKKLWNDLTLRLAHRGLLLPSYLGIERGFYQCMKALESARMGAPVGWHYANLIEVGHHLYNSHKPLLLLYGFAVQAYGRKALIEAQDESGKWAPKALKIKKAIADKDPAFEPDLSNLGLLRFLFPEPVALLEQFLSRQRLSA